MGDLSATRDFLYINDTVNGFVEIAKSNSLIGQDCNIASQQEISMEDLANELIQQIYPQAKNHKGYKRVRPKKV